ncbi:MAG: glucosyltransferase domain-containing protein [Oscillospiraceae bacterium]|nr:glucosyltransferase domain-containing protein [Oscillospiraceae bacterium]
MRFDLVEKLRKTDVRYKTAVVSTFLWGVASQGMGLFNKFSVHDDVMNYGVGGTYYLGRWMLDYMGKLETFLFKQGHVSLPLFNGLLAIVLIAVSACLIIRMLEIRNLFLCAFIGGLMASFPVVTSIFGYMFCAHFFLFSLFFTVLGAYCICLGDKWYLKLAGIVLMGSAIGIYQAFFPVGVTLILMYLIAFSAKADDWKSLLKKIILSGLCMIAALVFYLVLNSVLLSVKDVSFDYFGTTSIGKASLPEYFRRAAYAYKEFFYPNINSKYYMYRDRVSILYKAVVLFSVLLSVQRIVKIYKTNRLNALICALLMLLFPISTNLILVMVGEQLVHSVMVYALLLPFVWFVWLLDKAEWKRGLVEKGAAYAATCVCVLILLVFCRYDNMAYLKATYAQTEAISYFTTLVTQIKETDGYSDELPVAFLNWIDDSSVSSGDRDKIRVRLFPYGDVGGYLVNYRWREFMWQWCGYAPTVVSADDFADLEEVKNMPHYPDDGSIKVIDGTVVVNF